MKMGKERRFESDRKLGLRGCMKWKKEWPGRRRRVGRCLEEGGLQAAAMRGEGSVHSLALASLVVIHAHYSHFNGF